MRKKKAIKEYGTSELASIIGIHPNTLRLYETWELISKPKRDKNGYRIYTDLYRRQMMIARSGYKVEILQNGLRKMITEIIKLVAKEKYDDALSLSNEYIAKIDKEREAAEDAIALVESNVNNKKRNKIKTNNKKEACHSDIFFKRKEVSNMLGITMDALRNWELNGLITIKRKSNGYRVYTEEYINRIMIINTLRCANYSLSSILRMLTSFDNLMEQISNNEITSNENYNNNYINNIIYLNGKNKVRLNKKKIKELLDNSDDEENSNVLSACDTLIKSLENAKQNALYIMKEVKTLKKIMKDEER